jgi:hypothetical protein
MRRKTNGGGRRGWNEEVYEGTNDLLRAEVITILVNNRPLASREAAADVS